MHTLNLRMSAQKIADIVKSGIIEDIPFFAEILNIFFGNIVIPSLTKEFLFAILYFCFINISDHRMRRDKCAISHFFRHQ